MHNEKKYKFRCVVCGKWYLSARPESRYCEFPCKMKAYRGRRKEGEQRVLKDLVEQLKKAREEQETLAKMKKENDARLKSLEEEIIMEMINSGQKSAAFEGIAKISVITKLEGKINDKDVFFQYLHDSNQAHLIKQDVNYMTLQSWLNEISGDELVRAHQSGLDYKEKATIRFTKA